MIQVYIIQAIQGGIVGFIQIIMQDMVGKMLMEGLDVYLPLVDDHGVDCVIKRENGTFIEVQIKARSRDVAPGDAALFAAIFIILARIFILSFILKGLI